MELREILKKCDHTLLGQTATWEDIRGILDDAMKFECASACIPAYYVKAATDIPLQQQRFMKLQTL